MKDKDAVRKLTDDEIITINQAAACLDGLIKLPRRDQRAIATKLFKLAGNPLKILDNVPAPETTPEPSWPSKNAR